MRTNESDATGRKGILAVLRQFEDIGWGPIENKHQDLGTDLYIQVRDRGFELGVVTGAQVKTGSSYFGSSCTDADKPEGWWYAESDKRHFDYWKTHALPHLLVLHDLDANTSYWVHVVPDAVVDTGKGAKILVPAANTLDAAHLGALHAVASTGRPRVPLEGTAWAGGLPTSSADRFRFALIAPRLIAPSRSAPVPEDLGPERVLAMMALARFHEIESHQPASGPLIKAKNDLIPSFETAASSENWRWRFVAAFESRIRDGDIRLLKQAVETADAPDRKAAATVALVAALIEDGAHGDAINYLTTALGADDLAPVDHAWLCLQRARAALELTDLQNARADADSVLGIRDRAPNDVTASAIDGAARALIFTTAAWEPKDFGSVIQGADTEVSWWRAQTALGGLEAVTERTFKEWALDTSTSISASDDANNLLYVAALAAGHAGDHGAWRHLSTFLAQDTLLRFDTNADVVAVAQALTHLRRIGADKQLKQALVRLANAGPCRAITAAADDLDFGRSTYTTVVADLALVQHGGDLFSVDAAKASVEWLADSFDNPTQLAKLSAARKFDLHAQILETLAGLMKTVPEAVADFVVARLPAADLDAALHPLQIAQWTSLLRGLPRAVWTEERVEKLLGSALPAHDDPMRYPILGVAKDRAPAARAAIEHEIEDGSLRALIAANYVHDLDGGLLDKVRDVLRKQVAELRAEAAEGTSMSFGSLDPAYVLGVIVLGHPSEDDADCLADLLADSQVSRSRKHGLLQLIAGRPVEFRKIFRDRLLPVVDLTAQSTSSYAPLFNVDTTGETVFIREVLRAKEPEFGQAFSQLLAGSEDQRMWAAHLAAQAPGEQYVAALLTLAHDRNPLVRAQAAGGLARLAVTNRGGEVVLAAVADAVTDPGRAAPIAVASELGAPENLNPELKEHRTVLLTHPSAAVRTRVNGQHA